MKAYDFEYNGRTLSSFGMILCRFDSGGLETIDGVQITFNTVSTLNGEKHKLTSVKYEDCLEATVQICKNSCTSDVTEISSHEYRELMKWLTRKKFLKLKILDEDHIDLYYEASFVSINRIEIDGRLYGLELNILTNRPFALKEPQTVDVKTNKLYTWEKYYKTSENKKGDFTGEYVTSYDRNKYPDDGIIIYPDGDIEPSYTPIEGSYYYVYGYEENVTSINNMSYEEGYIYPYTEITVLEDGDLDIYSVLENRNTIIKNCVVDEVITMDYPIIQSSVQSHNIQNDFNWNFFRIANTYDNSRNDLTTSIPCKIQIRYSPIVKVGL